MKCISFSFKLAMFCNYRRASNSQIGHREANVITFDDTANQAFFTVDGLLGVLRYVSTCIYEQLPFVTRLISTSSVSAQISSTSTPSYFDTVVPPNMKPIRGYTIIGYNGLHLAQIQRRKERELLCVSPHRRASVKKSSLSVLPHRSALRQLR